MSLDSQTQYHVCAAYSGGRVLSRYLYAAIGDHGFVEQDFYMGERAI